MQQHAVSYGETSPTSAGRNLPAAVDESERPYLVHAVAKTLDLLDAFEQPGASLTLAELTLRVGLPKSSVLRLLRTLESRGFVDRSPDGLRYRLGLKLFELGTRVAARFQLHEAAVFVMVQLRDACGDTVNLGVLAETEVLLISVLESAHPLRKTANVGDREPAFCTALGKAILAHLPAARLAQVLRATDLEAHTPRTIADSRVLANELEEVRRRGYAIDDQEMLDGVRCVAAPILDHSGEVQGALSISGPVVRLGEERLPDLASLVRNAALDVSFRLGHRDRR